MSVGQNHTLILNRDGEVFACGCNENGELGLGELITNLQSAHEPLHVTGAQ
jgi:alpha-tubulin suppressor-like RCC1 family protein